jgi:benzylsuccinate CoA-transferase BbsF subunit
MVLSDGSEADPNLFSGIKVLAIGAFVAGNICPLIFTELGADVVKVETKQRPDALRQLFSPDHPAIIEPSGQHTTAMFSCVARGMRSVCLDLDVPGGRGALRDLAAHADILIENLGPGVMDKWGCSYSALSAVNPRLVFTSISGYGRTGPRSEYRAYGSSITMYLGLASVYGIDGTHFDYVAAYHGAYAAIGAWSQARLSGRGAFLDVSQMDAGAAVMAPLYLDALVNDRPWTYGRNEVPGSLLSTVVRCAGHDSWAAIDLEDAADWTILCDVLERPDLAIDDETEIPACADLNDALSAWSRSLTPYQVAIKLQAAGLAVAPVQNGEDLWRDPQLRSNAAFVQVDHPDVGTLEQPQSPDRMSSTPAHVVGRSPRLGEHTREVLGRWLGLDEAGFRGMLDGGAVWQAP